MKNKKIILAVIAALLLGVAGFFGYQTYNTKYNTPEAFVAKAFKAIVPTWDEAAMVAHQGPYMQSIDKGGENTKKLFSIFKNLGAFKESKECKQIVVNTVFPPTDGVQPPKETVSFHCSTAFEKDTAQVIIVIGKENNKWGIAGLRVFSEYIDNMVKAKQVPEQAK